MEVGIEEPEGGALINYFVAISNNIKWWMVVFNHMDKHQNIVYLSNKGDFSLKHTNTHIHINTSQRATDEMTQVN